MCRTEVIDEMDLEWENRLARELEQSHGGSQSLED